MKRMPFFFVFEINVSINCMNFRFEIQKIMIKPYFWVLQTINENEAEKIFHFFSSKQNKMI